jgi:hypothetical protein
MSLGSTVGYSAIARTLPVFISITEMVPLVAPMSCTCWAASCCRYHCRSLSIVSDSVPPSTAGTSVSVPGMMTPSLPFSNDSEPSVACMHAFELSSRPASGSPSVPKNPIRFPATAPLGYVRDDRGTQSMKSAPRAMRERYCSVDKPLRSSA